MSLAYISTELQRYILPVTIGIGVLGNIANMVVLTQSNLFNHACSRYFIALASNNLFYCGFLLVHRLLGNVYHLDLSSLSVFSCTALTYISTISAFLSPYFIVLASLDRFCASSSNAKIRLFSHIRWTKWAILFVITVFTLLFIHVIMFTVSSETARGITCRVQANTIYSQVYILVQVFFFAVVPPISMAVFGGLTIHNSIRAAIIARRTNSRFHRTERQLARMLFLQVATHISLTLPSSITYLISVLPNTLRTTAIFSFVSSIFQIIFTLSYTTPFFSYLLSSRLYRGQFLKLIKKLVNNRPSNQVAPSLEQTLTGQN